MIDSPILDSAIIVGSGIAFVLRLVARGLAILMVFFVLVDHWMVILGIGNHQDYEPETPITHISFTLTAIALWYLTS